MFITGQEIYSQSDALIQTEEYLAHKKGQLKQFFQGAKRFTFLGCGSSYMLSKTGENLFSTLAGVCASAIAGGDYITDPDWYRNMIEDSVVVAISRSGATTEMIRAVTAMKKVKGVKIVSLTTREGSQLAGISDFSLDMPWAFDNSVCQTRTVSNFYQVLVGLRCIYSEDVGLLSDMGKAVHGIGDFLSVNRNPLEALARRDFKDVVVLADGGLCGIGEEGALAFTEISIMSGKHFHMLDYRHGPIVLSGEQTLIIAALHPKGGRYQEDMIEDLKRRGCILVVIDHRKDDVYGADCHLYGGDMEYYISYGFPLIAACQMIAYGKAELEGINPDHPDGISAFVELKQEERG